MANARFDFEGGVQQKSCSSRCPKYFAYENSNSVQPWRYCDTEACIMRYYLDPVLNLVTRIIIANIIVVIIATMLNRNSGTAFIGSSSTLALIFSTLKR